MLPAFPVLFTGHVIHPNWPKTRPVVQLSCLVLGANDTFVVKLLQAFFQRALLPESELLLDFIWTWLESKLLLDVF